LKISFTCEACKKTLEGWSSPILSEEQNSPYYIELMNKFNTPQPLTVYFTGKTVCLLCAECHDKWATISMSWIKAGLILFGNGETKDGAHQ
jgi:hypothetical protein